MKCLSGSVSESNEEALRARDSPALRSAEHGLVARPSPQSELQQTGDSRSRGRSYRILLSTDLKSLRDRLCRYSFDCSIDNRGNPKKL